MFPADFKDCLKIPRPKPDVEGGPPEQWRLAVFKQCFHFCLDGANHNQSAFCIAAAEPVHFCLQQRWETLERPLVAELKFIDDNYRSPVAE